MLVFVAQGGGGLPSSNSAGSLAAMAMPSPPYMSPASSPSPPKFKPVQQQPPPMSDTQRPGSGSAKQIRVEAAATTIRVSTAPAAVPIPAPQAAYSSQAMPDPPAPRCWTPSKLGSSGGAAPVQLRSTSQNPASGCLPMQEAVLLHMTVLPSTSSACLQLPAGSWGTPNWQRLFLLKHAFCRHCTYPLS
jgi:hypothetical protein